MRKKEEENRFIEAKTKQQTKRADRLKTVQVYLVRLPRLNYPSQRLMDK